MLASATPRSRDYAGSRRSATLSSRIVADVRDSLLAGTLGPGDILGTERSLSEEFDVSRVAVRDALKCLEAMGVIQIRPGAGGGARIAHGNIPLFADVLGIQLRLMNAAPSAILDAQRAIEMMTAETGSTASDERGFATNRGTVGRGRKRTWQYGALHSGQFRLSRRHCGRRAQRSLADAIVGDALRRLAPAQPDSDRGRR